MGQWTILIALASSPVSASQHKQTKILSQKKRFLPPHIQHRKVFKTHRKILGWTRPVTIASLLWWNQGFFPHCRALIRLRFSVFLRSFFFILNGRVYPESLSHLGKGSNNQNGNLRWFSPWRGGGSWVPHTYSEKWFFFRIIPWLWKRVLHLVWALYYVYVVVEMTLNMAK